MTYQTRSKGKRKRGRPKTSIEAKVKGCPCGGATGKGVCKKAIVCDKCGKCKYGCQRDPCCRSKKTINIDDVTSTPNNKTRLQLGIIKHREGDLNEIKMLAASHTPPSVQSLALRYKKDIVHHTSLASAKATVTDLAQAFGRKKFNIPNARDTIFGLKDSITNNNVPQSDHFVRSKILNDDENTVDSSDESDCDVEEANNNNTSKVVELNMIEDNYNKSKLWKGSNEWKYDKDDSRRLHFVLKTVNNYTTRILAGGNQEARALHQSYVEKMANRIELNPFVENAKVILSSTDPQSEAHRAVKAILFKSMSNNMLQEYRLPSSKRAISQARLDFQSLQTKGKILKQKHNPHGKSFVSDEVIKHTVQLIVKCCSTTA